MRPPFAYYGGKAGMARRLVGLMPPHRVYIEPFAGSLAVLFAKTPAQHEIVNDLDDALVTFFRMLRERPADLEHVCSLTPTARAEYDLADLDAPGLDDLELARRFWVRVNQSFAKTAGRQTGWSVTTARTQSVPGSIHSRIGRFGMCAERLAQVAIEHCDAVDLIDRLANAETVVYCDPPYLASTRTSRFSGVKDYRVDGGDTETHERLAEALHRTTACVVLSGYPSPDYDRLYGDWWSTDFSVTTHSSNMGPGSTRGARIERVWSNRELVEHQALDLFDEEGAACNL